MERIRLKRYWINQPSTLQPEHKYHGLRVLGPVALDTDIVEVWPASGEIVSMKIWASALSVGWP